MYLLESLVEYSKIEIELIVEKGHAAYSIAIYDQKIINNDLFVASIDIKLHNIFAIGVIKWNLRSGSAWINNIFKCFFVFVYY